MQPPESGAITGLLASFHDGDQEVLEELFRIVLPELHRAARYLLAGERKEHMLQPTALINEAFLRLFDGNPVPWENGPHFLRSAVREMRRVLVDYARQVSAQKRSHEEVEMPADVEDRTPRTDPAFYIDLDRALTELAQHNERAAAIVEMTIFGEVSSEEVGVALGVSPRTVTREWRWARAWLRRNLYR